MMKKLMKKTVAVVLSSTMLLSGLAAAPNLKSFADLPVIVASAYTLKTVTSGYVTYTYHESDPGYATITKIDLSNSCPNNYSLTIPSTLGGLQTDALDDNAFQGNASKIVNLDIPNSVLYIGRCVFKECTNLDTIILPLNMKGIDECCFSNNVHEGVLNTLKLRRSNGTVFTVTRPYIDSVASSTTLKFISSPFNFKVTSGNDVLVSLFMAVNATAFGQRMCSEKATKIKTIYTQNSMTDRQKMQALYNYLVTNTRYSYVECSCKVASFYNHRDSYFQVAESFAMNQSAMGVLFFNSGVCAGYARAMEYLGKAANLDVKVTSSNEHSWNLFRPSGSSRYYVVDGVWGECGTGYRNAKYSYAKNATQTCEDGTVCSVAPYQMGSTRQFEVRNDKKNSNFNISLVNRFSPSTVYFSYNTYSKNDQGILHCTDLPEHMDEFLFADSTAKFDLQIRDANGYLLYTVTDVLSDVPRYCLFYDKQGQYHTVHISLNTENSEQNQRTAQNCRYVIRLDV